MATDNIYLLIGLTILLPIPPSGPSDAHADDKTSPIMIQILVGEMSIANTSDQNKGKSSDIFLFDYFFGIYASVYLAKWMRFYLGTGPLLIFGSRTTEDINPLTEKKESAHDSGCGLGGYTRFGLEFIYTDRVIFSVGTRHTWTNLSLEGAAGKLDIEGWQHFGGLSFRY